MARPQPHKSGRKPETGMVQNNGSKKFLGKTFQTTARPRAADNARRALENTSPNIQQVWKVGRFHGKRTMSSCCQFSQRARVQSCVGWTRHSCSSVVWITLAKFVMNPIHVSSEFSYFLHPWHSRRGSSLSLALPCSCKWYWESECSFQSLNFELHVTLFA